MYHDVKWTHETVRRFWDYYGTNVAAEDSYFSKKFAPSIIGVVKRAGGLADPVIDVGSGPGFLVDELLRRGWRCKSIDSSSRSIERQRARLGSAPGFLGALVGDLADLPVADAEAGTVFLIEALEHVPAASQSDVLGELARVVRPGGHLVVTVPNEEDLDAKKLACPECGCVFHRMQHLQSFDAATLGALLEANGFDPVLVEPLNFRDGPDRLLGRAIARMRPYLPALRSRRIPHLMAIARRRTG